MKKLLILLQSLVISSIIISSILPKNEQKKDNFQAEKIVKSIDIVNFTKKHQLIFS